MVIEPAGYIYICGENDGNLLVTTGAWQTTMGSSSTTEGAILKFRELAIVTGLEDPDVVDGKLNIFPNPTSGKLFVFNDGKTTLEITNVVGEIILRKEIYDRETEIDISAQSSGIYFVKLGNTVTKIIKQ